ncbi:MAG: MFS transporter, partial [Thermoleophilaceae bacterium]
MGERAGGRVNTIADLLRNEPRARAFLLTHLQSSLGTGAGYVALVVIAYRRFHSPWAITLVLLADFLPVMLFGPLIGAIVDRWSRRWCAVAADAIRAVAFVGIGLVSGFEVTVALAVLAGFGTALFSPSILSALPSLVEKDRLPAITSLYGSVTDLGRTVGPLIAAISFPLVGAEVLLVADGVTFGISAVVLATLSFGARTSEEVSAGGRALLQEAREGIATAARLPGVRVVLFASSAIVLFAATLNVAELLLARELHAGAAGYAVLLAMLGIGVVAGSLTAVRGSSPPELKSRYLGGLAVVSLGLLLLSVVPVYAAALPAFLITGIGNGLVVVHERRLFQIGVPERLRGRAFASLDTLASWAFAAAFLLSGALIAAMGTRELLA